MMIQKFWPRHTCTEGVQNPFIYYFTVIVAYTVCEHKHLLPWKSLLPSKYFNVDTDSVELFERDWGLEDICLLHRWKS